MIVPLPDELLTKLSSPHREAAAELCVALVESGMALRELVDDVLAPAMKQVGLLWQSADWAVVDEHIATAAAEMALSAAAAIDRQAPTRGEIVVACVEGDWHSLPSRMLAEVLDNEGWSVRFLGASQPLAQITDYVLNYAPHAVMLSCALPAALPTLLNAIDALHQIKSTVFVGGLALGTTTRRAVALGADGWAPNTTRAAALLEEDPLRRTRPASAIERLPRYHDLDQLISGWTDSAMTELTALSHAEPYSADAEQRTVADLHHLLDTAAIAVLVDDETLIIEQARWLANLHAARAVSANALPQGLDALLSAGPPGDVANDARSLLVTARASLLMPDQLPE